MGDTCPCLKVRSDTGTALAMVGLGRFTSCIAGELTFKADSHVLTRPEWASMKRHAFSFPASMASAHSLSKLLGVYSFTL